LPFVNAEMAKQQVLPTDEARFREQEEGRGKKKKRDRYPPGPTPR